MSDDEVNKSTVRGSLRVRLLLEEIYCGLFLEPDNTDLTLQGIWGTKDRNFPMRERS